MDNPVWLKIWLGVLAVPVTIGFFPFIVMYFKVNDRPMWEQRDRTVRSINLVGAAYLL